MLWQKSLSKIALLSRKLPFPRGKPSAMKTVGLIRSRPLYHRRFLMRLLAAAVALVVPFLTYGFTPTTPSLQRAPGSSLPLRCPSCRFNTIMNNLDSTHAKIKVAGTVLLGGALLATGLVDSAGVARADLSISPRCEQRCMDKSWKVCLRR